MKRVVAVVVPRGDGKYLRALVREDGVADMDISEQWDENLNKAFQLPTFRTLVIPEGLEFDEDSAEFWVRRIDWTAQAQDFWMEYLKKLAENAPEKFPKVIADDVAMFSKAIQATHSQRWSAIMLNSNFRFLNLYAYLLGLKELHHIRTSKKSWGISSKSEVISNE